MLLPWYIVHVRSSIRYPSLGVIKLLRLRGRVYWGLSEFPPQTPISVRFVRYTSQVCVEINGAVLEYSPEESACSWTGNSRNLRKPDLWRTSEVLLSLPVNWERKAERTSDGGLDEHLRTQRIESLQKLNIDPIWWLGCFRMNSVPWPGWHISGEWRHYIQYEPRETNRSGGFTVVASISIEGFEVESVLVTFNNIWNMEIT